MSMPSSRLAVAATARRRPRFSRSSVSRRRVAEMLPWWGSTRCSSAISFSSRLSRSTAPRVFAKMMVERRRSISLSSLRSSDGQSSPASIERKSGAAVSTAMSSRLREPASTIRTGRGRPPES